MDSSFVKCEHKWRPLWQANITAKAFTQPWDLRKSLPTAVTSFFHIPPAYAWINTSPWGQCSKLTKIVNATLTLSADYSMAWEMHVAIVHVCAISITLDELWYFQNTRLKKGYFMKSVTEGVHMLSDKYHAAFFIIINAAFTHWKHQQYSYQ